jgi:hypothetical protein
MSMLFSLVVLINHNDGGYGAECRKAGTIIEVCGVWNYQNTVQHSMRIFCEGIKQASTLTVPTSQTKGARYERNE